jgi:hypothetical protein
MAQARRVRLVSRRRVLAAGLVGLPVVVGSGVWWWGWGRSKQSTPPPREASSIPRRETRPTLAPSRFTGKVALAHQAAREIPDVLDQLHCYCGCDRTVGHVSLLSCYTDNHAVT